MARQALPQLTPEQVAQLEDELLANADRLLNSALSVLGEGNIGLARSLVILALEESGKAIGLHRRRVKIAFEAEQSPFVDDWLQKLWSGHKAKLRLAYEFLVEEKYWFSSEPPDPVANGAALGEIEEWITDHNTTKQGGFYVDVDLAQGAILAPETEGDQESLRVLLNHVHQIGWQLRLGEHIVASQQASSAAAIPRRAMRRSRTCDRVRAGLASSSPPSRKQCCVGGARGVRPSLYATILIACTSAPPTGTLSLIWASAVTKPTRASSFGSPSNTVSRTAPATTLSAPLSYPARRWPGSTLPPQVAAGVGTDSVATAWTVR